MYYPNLIVCLDLSYRNTFFRYCDRLCRALDLYDFLKSSSPNVDGDDVEMSTEDVNRWNEEEDQNMIKTITDKDPNVDNKESTDSFRQFSVAELSSW